MIFSFLILLACAPKKTETATAELAPPSRSHITKPEALPKKSFVPPSLQEATLSNNIPVFLQENQEVPLVRVWISFEAGSWTDPDEQIGLSSITMDMLDEGSQDLTGAELSAQLRNLGSSLSISNQPDGSIMEVQALKQNLAPTLALLQTVLKQPLFPETVWERKKAQYLQSLAQQHNDAKSISRNVWNKLLYKDQYMGRLQTQNHINSISTKNMRTWYDQFIVPQTTKIWVGGATTLEEVQPILEENFGTWTKTPNKKLPSAPSEIALKEPPRSFIYLVDKPGATQSIIRIGHGIGHERAPETTALTVANNAIGGMFTARINQFLREEKGWTYGAWTWLAHNYYPGSFNMSSSVVTEHTADSIREVVRILRSSKGETPITQVEVDRAKGDLMGTFPMKFEKPDFAIHNQLRIMRYQLPADWISGYEQRVNEVTLKDAQSAWNDNIDPETIYILIVGDKNAIESSLLTLGYPIIPMNTYGEKIKTDK